MKSASPTSYALLGLLAVRSWTGYELTNQLRRSLRFVWPSSEGHLYREQKRLVDLGWAELEREPAGKRQRNRYTITPTGANALKRWLATEPGEPRFEIEGILRMFYGDQGTSSDLIAAMESTSTSARIMLNEMLDIVDEYLEEGGPLWMLENDVGGPDQNRLEFHGRPQYPERLHYIAHVIDITTQLLADVENFAVTAAAELATWPGFNQKQLTASTRQRLETIRNRHRSYVMR